MILVTGGMGFIGLHTAKTFLERGHQVVLTQHRSRRSPEFLNDYLKESLFIEQVDIRDRSALIRVLKGYPISDIAHLVAPALNSLAPDDDFETSVLGVLNILQTAREATIRRVLLASSSAVYTGLPAGPFREDMPLSLDVQSATETFKKVWEILGTHYSNRTGLQVVNMRIGSIWGPLFWHGGIFPVARLCYAATRGTGLGEGPELFEDDESAPCYVSDCAAGIAALQASDALNHKTYNVSTDRAVTNRQIISSIQKVIPSFDIQLTPGVSSRNRHMPYLDITRLKTDTGFSPQFSLDAAVADYVRWLVDHPEESISGAGPTSVAH